MLLLLMWLLCELWRPYLMLTTMCFMYVKFVSVNYFIRSSSKRNVLFVTAHPDDECMFFTPCILSLLREGHNIYLVCLSKGDHDGQGEIRKKELIASCSKLGILHSRVTIVDDEKFQDGPDKAWDIDALGERILAVVQRVNADSLVTFDASGVSGHVNHIAVYNAIHKLHKDEQLNDKAVFTLKSTSLLRKYVSLFDIPASSIFNLTTFVSLPSQVVKSWQAMSAHHSQMVWFRKLYIVFSRYMFVNTLQAMN